MGTLLQDLRFGFRMLLRSPTVTAVAILSLALGVGANTTIFTLVNAVFFQPLPVEQPERLVAVFGRDEKNAGDAMDFMPVSFPNFVDYRDHNEVLSGLAAYRGVEVNLSGAGAPEEVNGLIVSGSYFDVLGVRAAVGRTFLPEEDRTPGTHPVVVISHGLWQRRFGGDPSVAGRTLTLNTQTFSVVGVAPKNFRGTSALDTFDLWVPMMMHGQVLTGNARRYFNERRALLFNVVGRLKPGVEVARAQSAMQTIGSRLQQEYREENEGRNVVLMPLLQTTISPDERATYVRAGGLLTAAVGMVLLIACANIANLLLARSNARRKEIAIRASLGAGRWRIIRQLLTESLLLGALGGAAGLLLAYWGRALLWSFRPPFLDENAIDLTLNARVLVFTLLLSLLTGLIFGLAPALRTSRLDLAADLKDRTNQAGRTGRWFNLLSALVVLQVALSLVSLIGAGLFVRSLRNAQQIDPGFETDKLIMLPFKLGAQGYSEERGREFYRHVQERVESLPGVRSAAVASNAPFTGGLMRSVTVEGQEPPPGGRGVLTLTNVVGLKYFTTLGIPLLRGRDFAASDQPQTVKVAVINEAAGRRFWPGQDPVGRRFKFFGEDSPVEVVGVVKDSDAVELGEESRPVIYLPMAQRFVPTATLHVSTSGAPESLLGPVRREAQAADPNLPLPPVTPISEVIAQALWAPRMGAALLTIFGLIALALAAVGVYGVLAYTVSQRTHEIGLRMALGAQTRDILWLVLKRGLILVAAGAVVGLVAGFAATRLISDLLYGVSPGDPVTFSGTAALLIVVALAASYIPARRAAGLDPLVALRRE